MQSKGKREPAKGEDLLKTSLRVLEEQEDELQEARHDKERTERENRQLRHQMENLCTDLGINRLVYVCLSVTNRKTLVFFYIRILRRCKESRARIPSKFAQFEGLTLGCYTQCV